MLTTDTLLTGTTFTAFVPLVVQYIKALCPAAWWAGKPGDARAIALTFAVSLVIVMSAWAIGGYLPEWVTWRDALRTAIWTAVQASGLYAMLKRMMAVTTE